MLHPTFPLPLGFLLQTYFIQNLCAETRNHTILSFYSRRKEVGFIPEYSQQKHFNDRYVFSIIIMNVY